MPHSLQWLISEGQLRVDANVSLAIDDSSTLGVRTEVKNLNSLKSVYSAINYEIIRQYEVLNQGGEVLNETRTVDHKGLAFMIELQVVLWPLHVMICAGLRRLYDS